MITYPYALADLADLLPIQSVVWDVRRNDELSGTGDGRVWPAELAPPLWTGEVRLEPDSHDAVKRIATRIRKLHGAQEAFYLHDPLSPWPQADPGGVIVAAATVQVHSVGAERHTLRLKGLPAGYRLTIGDKGQIAYAGTLNFFFEFSEDATADGAGVTPEVEVFPHVPAGVVADDTVTLKKPAALVFVMPGSFHPGTARGVLTEGVGFTVMERKR